MSTNTANSSSTPVKRKFDPKLAAKKALDHGKREGCYNHAIVTKAIDDFSLENGVEKTSFIFGLAMFFIQNGYASAIILNNNTITCMDSASGDYKFIGSNEFFTFLCPRLEVQDLTGLVLKRVAEVPVIATQMPTAFSTLNLQGNAAVKGKNFLNIIAGSGGQNMTKQKLEFPGQESGNDTSSNNDISI